MAKQLKTKKKTERKEQRGSAKNPTRTSAIHYDYIMNGYGLSPNYIQNIVSRQKVGIIGAGGYGAYRFQENPDPLPMKKLWPHRHPKTEYFILYGTNPDKPDDLGGTCEFWLGEGKDAEPYIITKPTVIVVPPNLTHLPQGFRGYHGINAQTVVYDAPLWCIDDGVELPAGMNTNKTADPSKFGKKYQGCVNERNLTYAPYFPAHKGKSQVILHHDNRQNRNATHHIEVNLISGSGIGWGCGDMMEFADYQTRSFPHIHDVPETYIFVSIDPDNPGDLGGTIEFWMGEGKNAKKITIDKPTILIVPPNTVHLPMYVRELHHPIITIAMLDTPLWSVYNIRNFPPAFKHVAKPDVAAMKQFHLEYDRNKCTHCHLCEEQCQVQGIDLSKNPPVVGDPCIRCGQCALLCPAGALTAELR